MTGDLLLAWGAVLVCVVIAFVDPVALWRKRQRARRVALNRRIAPRAPPAPACTPPSSPPAPPSAPSCSACSRSEVVAFQLSLPVVEVHRINTQLHWHRSARREEGRA